MIADGEKPGFLEEHARPNGVLGEQRQQALDSDVAMLAMLRSVDCVRATDSADITMGLRLKRESATPDCAGPRPLPVTHLEQSRLTR